MAASARERSTTEESGETVLWLTPRNYDPRAQGSSQAPCLALAAGGRRALLPAATRR